MILHRSNRIERLATALGEVLSAPAGGDPLAPEAVVVASRGMARWLSLHLAQQHGVCAHVQFPFPESVLSSLLGAEPDRAAAGGDAAPQPDWAPDSLAWSVLAVLRQRAGDADLAALWSYLGSDGLGAAGVTDRRAWLLARRIADALDRYTRYRPEMVRRWEAGDLRPEDRGADAWQPVLWRALCDRIPSPHFAARAQAFLRAADAGDPCPPGFPARLSVFGLSALPPLYVEVLGALARHREVHLFVLCPSREFWGEIRSRRETARMLRENHWEGEEPEALHLEEGHPLLASLGRLGRDFQVVLEGRAADTPYVEPPGDLFEDPGTGSALAALQSDILHLRHRRPPRAGRDADPDALPLALDPADRSVRFHACHGPMRQVEVLRDELLSMMAADPTLQPRDIVVMAPDIEACAPLVEAVFSDGDGPGEHGAGFPRLPFRIADRGLRSENPVAAALARLLEVAAGRLPASAVLDLLALEAVQRRFDLRPEDLPAARRWVAEAGIRWGADADHRRAQGQPPYDEYTWQAGLDRLLLGIAMEGDGHRTFCGVLPCDAAATGGAALGGFAAFATTLLEQVRDLPRPRGMAAWRERLLALMDALVAAGDDEMPAAVRVRSAIDELAGRADAAGFDGDVDLDAVRALLDGAFVEGGSAGFLGGSVTVCALVPMRSLPFRVVCLLGMDDGAWPRESPRTGFDRVASAPRMGDRSPRDDDRYLLLEALLSARQHLRVFYTGRDVRDNRPRPPAVPVGEMLDALAATFAATPDEARAVRDRLVVPHPLQPFSPRNFPPGQEGDGLFRSFDRRLLAGAHSLRAPRDDPPPFLAGPLPAMPAEDLSVSVDALSRFLQGPVAGWLAARLGVRLEEYEDEVADREPAILGPLEEWAAGTAWLRLRLEGVPDAEAARLLAAGGHLPLGSAGRAAAEFVRRRAEPVRERVASLAGGATTATPGDDATGTQRGGADGRAAAGDGPGLATPAVVAVDLEVAGVPDGDGTATVRLSGAVAGVGDGGRLAWQYGRLRARHRLDLWLRHLALAAQAPHRAGASDLVGRGEDGHAEHLRLSLPGDPAARHDAALDHLRVLLGLWRAGQRWPLPFFPETSRAWFQAGADEGPEGFPPAVRGAWLGTGPRPGEAGEPAVARLYGEAAPWLEGFVPEAWALPASLAFPALARTVWGPLVAAEGGEP